MKKTFLVLFCLMALLFASCGDKGIDTPVNPKTKDTVVIGSATPSVITTNTTWTADKKYLLKGFVYIAPGATLTIQPGTIIYGDKETKGSLIITRGAKIMAEGTAQNPIVFTSYFPKGINPATNKSYRQPGDWGGLILLGKAPINVTGGGTTNTIEGGLSTPTGTTEYNRYGGDDPADNSGVLKYVRVEFAGVAYQKDDEINGITFGGVGSGTTVSHVQVYASGDDSFEWFGGTINADHLVTTKTWDDDLDTDNGYSGKVQFAIIQRHPNFFDQSQSNGFESDNNNAKSGARETPQTKAVFSNVTVIGPINTGVTVNALFRHGAQIRRNSSQSIINSIFVGYPIGVYIDDQAGAPTSANYKSGSLVFKNNIIAGCTEPVKATDATIIPLITADNMILANTIDAKIADAYKFNAKPSFLLQTGSPALTGASFAGFTGFQNVAYRGAFDSSGDWTTGWTNWDAENTEY